MAMSDWGKRWECMHTTVRGGITTLSFLSQRFFLLLSHIGVPSILWEHSEYIHAKILSQLFSFFFSCRPAAGKNNHVLRSRFCNSREKNTIINIQHSFCLDAVCSVLVSFVIRILNWIFIFYFVGEGEVFPLSFRLSHFSFSISINHIYSWNAKKRNATKAEIMKKKILIFSGACVSRATACIKFRYPTMEWHWQPLPTPRTEKSEPKLKTMPSHETNSRPANHFSNEEKFMSKILCGIEWNINTIFGAMTLSLSLALRLTSFPRCVRPYLKYVCQPKSKRRQNEKFFNPLSRWLLEQTFRYSHSPDPRRPTSIRVASVNLKLYPINNENVPSWRGFAFRAPTPSPPPPNSKWENGNILCDAMDGHRQSEMGKKARRRKETGGKVRVFRINFLIFGQASETRAKIKIATHLYHFRGSVSDLWPKTFHYIFVSAAKQGVLFARFESVDIWDPGPGHGRSTWIPLVLVSRVLRSPFLMDRKWMERHFSPAN